MGDILPWSPHNPDHTHDLSPNHPVSQVKHFTDLDSSHISHSHAQETQDQEMTSESRSNSKHDLQSSNSQDQRVKFLRPPRKEQVEPTDDPKFKILPLSSSTFKIRSASAWTKVDLSIPRNQSSENFGLHLESSSHRLDTPRSRISPEARISAHKQNEHNEDTDVLSRGRRTQNLLSEATDSSKEDPYFPYREKYKKQDTNGDRSREISKKGSGEWIEYDFDQGTTTTTEDPSLPEDPAGLKNPKLLVGPWVEEPPISSSKARFG